MKGIAVYCASSTHIAEAYYEAARAVGELIALKGLPVINGAGHMGLMGAVTDGARAAGGDTIGVIPQFMVDKGLEHRGMSQLIVTPDMHTRKRQMADLACGVIALPGGVGTLDELAEMLTWRQLGLFSGPVVILNIDGYYDHLLAWLDHAVAEHFVAPDHKLWQVARTPAEAVDMATASAS